MFYCQVLSIPPAATLYHRKHLTSDLLIMKPFIILNELFKLDKDVLLLQLLGFKGNVSSCNDTAKNKLIHSFFRHRHVHYPSSPSDHDKDIFILSLLDYDGAILEDDDVKEQCFNILLEERNRKAVMEFEHAADRRGVASGSTALQQGPRPSSSADDSGVAAPESIAFDCDRQYLSNVRKNIRELHALQYYFH